MSNKTHSLKEYKESLIILPQLEAILTVFKLAEKALSGFRSFIPVAKVLFVIREQKYIIESHREKYLKIKKSKGLKI